MISLITTCVLAALTLYSFPPPVQDQNSQIDPTRYGALAYSYKTGRYGYASNQPTRAAAEGLARAKCNAEDARALTWVRNGWAVLVIAEDRSYGYDEVHGDGAKSDDAYQSALKNLRRYTDAKVKTIIIICSGDVPPKVIEN